MKLEVLLLVVGWLLWLLLEVAVVVVVVEEDDVNVTIGFDSRFSFLYIFFLHILIL